MAARIKSLKLSEKEFTAQVIELANRLGWRVAHFRPGMTSRVDANGKTVWTTPVQGQGKGWPDLFLVRGEQALGAELKVGNNKPTPEQTEWLLALAEAGISAAVWTPNCWALIEETLR